MSKLFQIGQVDKYKYTKTDGTRKTRQNVDDGLVVYVMGCDSSTNNNDNDDEGDGKTVMMWNV